MLSLLDGLWANFPKPCSCLITSSLKIQHFINFFEVLEVFSSIHPHF